MIVYIVVIAFLNDEKTNNGNEIQRRNIEEF